MVLAWEGLSPDGLGMLGCVCGHRVRWGSFSTHPRGSSRHPWDGAMAWYVLQRHAWSLLNPLFLHALSARHGDASA